MHTYVNLFGGSFTQFFNTAHETLGKTSDVTKSCIMDYLIIQRIFSDSSATSLHQAEEIGLCLVGKHSGTRTCLREGALVPFAACM